MFLYRNPLFYPFYHITTRAAAFDLPLILFHRLSLHIHTQTPSIYRTLTMKQKSALASRDTPRHMARILPRQMPSVWILCTVYQWKNRPCPRDMRIGTPDANMIHPVITRIKDRRTRIAGEIFESRWTALFQHVCYGPPCVLHAARLLGRDGNINDNQELQLMLMHKAKNISVYDSR